MGILFPAGKKRLDNHDNEAIPPFLGQDSLMLIVKRACS
jgi:hypothetical protein